MSGGVSGLGLTVDACVGACVGVGTCVVGACVGVGVLECTGVCPGVLILYVLVYFSHTELR